MKRITLLLILLPSLAGAQFAYRIGSAGQEYGKALVVDQSNDIIVAALFQNTVNVNPGGTTNLVSAGMVDACLVRYDQAGHLMWGKRFGGSTTTDVPHGVGTDNAGNIWVCGAFGTTADNFPHTADFDPAGGGTLTTQSRYDGFLAKYDANGVYQWALGLGSTTSTTEERCWDIAVDTSGFAYITGAFHGTVDFNPRGAAPIYRTTSKTEAGLFLAKYNGNGICQWVVSVDAGIQDVFNEGYASVDFDQRYGVFWGGNFRGTNVNFNPGASFTLSSAGQTDMFLANFNGVGLFLWAMKFGGAAADIMSPGAMRLDHQGNPAFTGRIAGPVDFNPTGGGAVVNNASLFLASYTPKGFFRQVVGMPGIQGSGGHRIAFDGQDFLFIAGWIKGTVDFDPVGTLNVTATSPTSDIFLAKYSPVFTLEWVNHFGAAGSSDNNICAGLDVDRQEYPCITGQFYGSPMDFDPSPTVTFNLTNLGQNDCFVAKYTEMGELNAPVPVELAGFSAEPVDDGVLLRWSTVTESGNHGFDIQRSDDGGAWQRIGFMQGAGTTTELREYEHRDASGIAQQAQVLRYRLVQIDVDGRRTASPVIEVRRDGVEDLVITARHPDPAPSMQMVHVALAHPAALQVTVTDVTGRTRHTMEVHRDAGTHILMIPTADLPTGVYSCRIMAESMEAKHPVRRFTLRVVR